jgi:DNA-binding NarL/FixJ family response regulator
VAVEGAIRIISIDDHPAISDALSSASAEAADLELIGSFTSVEAVPVPLRRRDFVDIVLLDLSLPGAKGIEAVRTTVGWGAPVLVFSASAQRRVADDALAAGARGFVGKSTPTAQLFDAIRAVHRGGRAVHGIDDTPDLTVRLTDSETHLLRFICSDTRSRELADRMGVSSRTIDNMVTELYRKLGFSEADRSRASLRDWARAHGLDRV